ncbi:MAG TPA: hypothetical protein VK348_01250, partial [Planctomycetota bacterium]|nr:hypothetical protein [Planctomycetota bacterium]
RYAEALQARAAGSAHVGIYQGVDAPWLDAEWQADADRRWDEAERLAAADAPLRARVRAARLSVDYPCIERARLRQQPATPELRARVERFLATAAACGLVAVRESGGDLAAYARELHAALGL